MKIRLTRAIVMLSTTMDRITKSCNHFSKQRAHNVRSPNNATVNKYCLRTDKQNVHDGKSWPNLAKSLDRIGLRSRLSSRKGKTVKMDSLSIPTSQLVPTNSPII